MLYFILFSRIICDIQAQHKVLNYTTIDGLSHNTIYEITQDKNGLIWMGTESGLSNFDGQHFNTTLSTYRDQLPSHFVTCVTKDHTDKLWIGTTKGLRRMNQKLHLLESPIKELENKSISDIKSLVNGQFLVSVNGFGLYIINENYQVSEHWHKASENYPLSSNLIETIFIDKKSGLIWVGTKDAGIDLINLSNHYTTSFPIGIGLNQIPSQRVYNFTQSKNGDVWVGTKKGLCKYDFKQKTISRIDLDVISNTSILSVHVDQEDNLWIGTELNGLWKMKEGKNTVLEPVHISDRNISVRAIYEDHQQNIWIGSQRNGLFLLKSQYHTFQLLNKEQLKSDIVWGILIDGQKVWAGTDGAGITVYNLDNKTTKQYQHQPSDPTSLSDNSILSALKDSKGRYWFGTYDGGVNLYQKDTDSFFRMDQNRGLIVNDVRCFHEDKNGTIWVGTNRGGLHYFDENQEAMISIDATKTMDIRSIASRNNLLWLGTFDDGGIYTYDVIHRQLEKFTLPINIEIIFDLVFDQKEDILWIGTYDKGLLAYHFKEQRLEEFKQHKDLHSNIIHAIQQDLSGKLWLTSNHGIIAFDHQHNIVNQHSIEEGIQPSDYMDRSKAISKDGTIFFGGASGLNFFSPSDITPQTYSPNIIITELNILNERVVPNDKHGVLVESISETDELVLKFNQNQFSIKYQGVDYKHPEALMYKYYLNGWDKEWNNVGKNNVASFSNLAPGEYNLLISTKVTGGPWSTPHVISITISPPIWNTWWAKLIYISILCFAFFIWKRFIDNRAKSKSELSLQVQKAKMHQENIEVYQDIIHELNTPINQLLMPLENMIHDKSNTSIKLKRQLQMLYFNASKIHNILRFILSNKTQEEKDLSLEVYQYNLCTFLQNFQESFQLQIQQRNIKFELKVPEENISGWFDIEKIETVMHFLFLSVIQNDAEGDSIMIILHAFNRDVKKVCQIDIHLLDQGSKSKKINLQKRKTTLIGIPMSKVYLEKHKGLLSLPYQEQDYIQLQFPIDKESYETSEIKMDMEESRIHFINT
ncbi:two-component regulator propeller domain-containing protein [Flammeovirga sp. EKP202]|uniref:ligand-binding sensor domain-containing protein n=1 Tax=Flammeovirga sp. EKP202 TaxID=2770592 RepID=UPI00165F8525|nr:two-component regulator propeller domain-containing protein [Flammeovirga sp. EKP202]MBD0404682.1 hypothetical protein [Flammeovirga sp. EKP202]